jgi:GNAT superfamily N-acetyltransferase
VRHIDRDLSAATRVRARGPEDVPALVQVLTEQQPGSGYPLRWPLPFPVERFIVRSYEEMAWVAERDGHLLGHVLVGRVDDDETAAIITAKTGEAELAIVSVLFVAQTARGQGIGKLLLDTAVTWAREHGRMPVLDVVPKHREALQFYRHLGWSEVGCIRPEWLPEDHDDVVLMALRP